MKQKTGHPNLSNTNSNGLQHPMISKVLLQRHGWDPGGMTEKMAGRGEGRYCYCVMTGILGGKEEE